MQYILIIFSPPPIPPKSSPTSTSSFISFKISLSPFSFIHTMDSDLCWSTMSPDLNCGWNKPCHFTGEIQIFLSRQILLANELLWIHMYVFVSWTCFLEVIHHHWILKSFHLFLSSYCWALRECYKESHLGISTPKFLSFFPLTICRSLF